MLMVFMDLLLLLFYPIFSIKVQIKKVSGIWIQYGMPFNAARKFYKGCLALNNPELENLEKNLHFIINLLIAQ